MMLIAILSFQKVYEETGYDISLLIEPDEYIEGVLNYQYTRLYIVQNVPIETVFVPRTRKEIKSCDWFHIEYLPTHKMDTVCKTTLGINANSFFMIMPFVKRLKRWLNDRKLGDPSASTVVPSTKSTKKLTPLSSTVATITTATTTTTATATTIMSTTSCNKKRQRHKSMGDLDGVKTVAIITTTATTTEPTLPPTTGASSNVVAKDVVNKKSIKTKQSNFKRQLFHNDEIRTGSGKSSKAQSHVDDNNTNEIELSNLAAAAASSSSVPPHKKSNQPQKIALHQLLLAANYSDPAIAKWQQFQFSGSLIAF